MNDLIANLFALLRLRAGPQDLPPSWSLTVVAIVIYLGQGILTGQQLSGEDNVPRTLFSSAVQILAVSLMLRFRGHAERVQQTLLALAGTGILLDLVAFVLLVQADPAQNQPALALIWFLVFGWSLAVDGNIYRHALSIPLAQGVLVAVGLLAVTYVIMQLIFMTSS